MSAGPTNDERADSLRDRLATGLAPDIEVVRLLGRGSMADVYLGREVELRRLVAVKVLRPEVAADETARRRFVREARSAAQIQHPNVVALYRVGKLDADLPYLVMEYVDGRNLADLLEASGPFDVDEGRTILMHLAAALAAAHGQGIVHRDVRPGNVLREAGTGRVVLSDFGLAAVRTTGDRNTTAITTFGTRIGEPEHMSPEQMRGDDVTTLADIYAFGVTAYEVLTGGGPYEARTMADFAVAHLRLPPTPLGELRPDVEPAFAELLERCLAKTPEHRPEAADLARLLSDDEALANHVSEPVLGSAFGSFLAELRRRQVYKIAAAYAAIAFVALEVGSIVLPSLRFLPRESNDMLVALVLAGFPVALALSWMFDLTRGGIKRTESVDAPSTRTRVTRLLFPALGLGLSLAAAGLIGWLILSSPS